MPLNDDELRQIGEVTEHKVEKVFKAQGLNLAQHQKDHDNLQSFFKALRIIGYAMLIATAGYLVGYLPAANAQPTPLTSEATMYFAFYLVIAFLAGASIGFGLCFVYYKQIKAELDKVSRVVNVIGKSRSDIQAMSREELAEMKADVEALLKDVEQFGVRFRQELRELWQAIDQVV
jgi:uncharacterized membrane protein